MVETNGEENLRRQKLREELLDVQERVGRIITQHDLVNSQHGELGDLAQQLKQIIEKIHLTCEESSQNADEMDRHGERLTTISDEFSALSLEGKQSLHDVVELVTSLQQDAETTTESMKRLEERSVEITGIVKVISDIASNTNLLALNAAIEAARAGEHGRGFAVVADEVRKLAEMTSHSTQNIAKLVETIIDETSNAIAHTYRNKEAIQNGLTACEGAFQKIGEIVHAFDEVHQEVSVVKNRIQKQKSLSNRIDSGMGDVNGVLTDVHNKIVSHIQEASIVDRELDASYEELKRLVEQEVL